MKSKFHIYHEIMTNTSDFLKILLKKFQ